MFSVKSLIGGAAATMIGTAAFAAGVADKRAFLAADVAPKSSHRYCSGPIEFGDTAVKVSASRS